VSSWLWIDAIDMVGSKMRTFGPKSGAAPLVVPPHVAVAVQLGGQLDIGVLDPEDASEPVDDEVLPLPPELVVPEPAVPLPPPDAPTALPALPEGADVPTPELTELPAPAPAALVVPLVDSPPPDDAPEPCVLGPADGCVAPLQPESPADTAAVTRQRLANCMFYSDAF
jgi:hypothetical protein